MVDSFDYERLDHEWVVLNAIRDAVLLALRGHRSADYLLALDIARDLLPGLYDPQESLLARAQEPPTVREYRQRAESESQIKKSPVSPIELLDEEIVRLKRYAQTPGARDKIFERRSGLEATETVCGAGLRQGHVQGPVITFLVSTTTLCGVFAPNG